MALTMLGSAAIDAGMGIVNNASNLIFGKKIQKQQLEGQKKALEQQNAASMDIWNKTNYEAQIGHLKAAGLNPGLLYGMGGGAGGQSGGNQGGGIQGAGAPGKIMDMQSIAQLRLLEAQKENIEADTKNKQAEAGFTTGAKTGQAVAAAANLGQDTKLKGEQTTGQQITNSIKKIEENIADSTQWYHIGKVEQDWLKAVQEYRSAATKANVDENSQETRIQQERQNLAMTILQQSAIRKGMQLTDAQINSLNGLLQVAFKDADTNKWNAESNATNTNNNTNRLSWEKHMKNVPDDLKMLTETLQDVLQALTLKGIINAQPKMNKIGY